MSMHVGAVLHCSLITEADRCSSKQIVSLFHEEVVGKLVSQADGHMRECIHSNFTEDHRAKLLTGTDLPTEGHLELVDQ